MSCGRCAVDDPCNVAEGAGSPPRESRPRRVSASAYGPCGQEDVVRDLC
jgi:hypothetical protein